MNKRYLRLMLKTLVAVPLCLVLYCYELEPGCRAGFSLTQAFCAILFGALDYQNSYVYMMTIENIAFILLFNLMFSSYISGHFRYSCVYVFSRVRNRKKWYIKRLAELLSFAFLYVVLYVGCVLIISMNASQQPLTSVALARIGMVCLFSFFLVGSITIASNLIALRFGTAIGLLITTGILLAFLALLLFLHEIKWAILLNPLACLNLFNSGSNGALFTTVYNFLILAVISVFGANYVSAYDVALFDAELN